MNTSWEEEAKRFYIEKFYMNNSEAHGIQHIKEVHKNMQDLIKSECLEDQMDDYMVLLCAYLHDIFCESHSAQHHVLAKEYVDANSDKFLQRLSQNERDIVGMAVLEHRSSCNMAPSTVYSKLLKTADNGPMDPEHIFKRCRAYHIKHSGAAATEKEIAVAMYKLLTEKYGENGYFYTDKSYCKLYAKEIEVMQVRIEEFKIKYDL